MEGWRAERTFLPDSDTHLWGNICALVVLSSFRNYSTQLWNKSLLSPKEMGIVWVALHTPSHLFLQELLEWQQFPQADVGGCEAGSEEGMDVRQSSSQQSPQFPGLVYPTGFLICLLLTGNSNLLMAAGLIPLVSPTFHSALPELSVVLSRNDSRWITQDDVPKGHPVRLLLFPHGQIPSWKVCGVG